MNDPAPKTPSVQPAGPGFAGIPGVPAAPSQLMVQRLADVSVIEFMQSALLDQASVDRIHRELDAIVAAQEVPKLVISFEGVKHISSAMLGVLIAMHRKTTAKHGGLRLASIPASIFEVFKITNLHKMLKIYDNTDKALLKF